MARDVSTSLGDRFVEAALTVLREHGAAALTVRQVAQAAGSSTMGVYTRFGGWTELLEAVYQRGFVMLRDALSESLKRLSGKGSRERIRALARGYRRFALANPELYALMFERPLPAFEPSPQARAEALAATFALLTDELSGKVRPAYLVWATVHGVVSLELTHTLRSPLPGWFIDSPQAGARILHDAVDAVLSSEAVSRSYPTAGAPSRGRRTTTG
jgi:AcrR family transcriptional regulator